MNLGKRKGNQPDYTGVLRFMDDSGKGHNIVVSAWVNITRNGKTLMSLGCSSHARYLEIAKNVAIEKQRSEDMDAQTIKERKQKRFSQTLAKCKAEEPAKDLGSECDDMYFGSKSIEGEIDDRPEEKESKVHDNLAELDSGKAKG